MMDDFKNQIEAFLGETGMVPSRFGREALNDPGFVSRMRSGARNWPETQEKCLSFMAEYIEKHHKQTDAAR